MNTATKRDIRLVNVAGVMGSVYGCLALGEILLLFVTQCLHIPKEEWALVASVLPLAGFVHLASAFLTEHFRRRKLLSLSCFAVSRLATPAIALLPFITGQTETQFRLYYLAGALIAYSAVSALGENAWLSWVTDIVPEKERGRFFAFRYTLATVVNVVVYVSAGRVLDLFGRSNPWGYVVTFGAAFLVGELDLLVHTGVADRPMPPHAERVRLRTLLAEPWRHRGFRSLMLQRMVVAFGDSIIGPFGFMYLVEELKMSATEICLLSAIFMTSQAVTFRLWRRAGERIGYRTIYLITHTLWGAGVMYWWFLPMHNHALALAMLIVARIFFGSLNSGLMLTISTLTLNTAPAKHRSVYFAQVTAAISIMMALGTFCGRWVYLHTNPTSDLMFLGTKLTGTHVLIGIFALFRLVTIRMFFSQIPDARSEAALPRLSRMLQTNPFRLLPTVLEFGRLMSPEEREEHVDSMRELMPAAQRVELEDELRTVLKDSVRSEDEFYGIIGRERIRRGRGLDRMLDEISELADQHIRPAHAKAGANRIRRLYMEVRLAACLRSVRRLAHRTADGWDSPMALSALSVIDALASAGVPEEDAVLLAVYAYLQIAREPQKRDND